MYRLPYLEMQQPVETPEVKATEALVEKLFTDKHTYEDRKVVEYKRPRTG